MSHIESRLRRIELLLLQALHSVACVDVDKHYSSMLSKYYEGPSGTGPLLDIEQVVRFVRTLSDRAHVIHGEQELREEVSRAVEGVCDELEISGLNRLWDGVSNEEISKP